MGARDQVTLHNELIRTRAQSREVTTYCYSESMCKLQDPMVRVSELFCCISGGKEMSPQNPSPRKSYHCSWQRQSGGLE
ncbi:hypothetical protein KC19_VG141300 [Ceratodon purpureus]|uniref:Uncharacterized protein n=1 Tax=Ceratodon purpureus TaxID=3225 RepID=A0A8T0HQF2_CERPU|nr:hypothetical protein KC19_VG141300 [Ceratodon purpureus]